MPQDVAEFLV